MKDEMYPMVAGALVGSLKEVSGPDLNAETEAAGLGAITFLAKTMMAGSAGLKAA